MDGKVYSDRNWVALGVLAAVLLVASRLAMGALSSPDRIDVLWPGPAVLLGLLFVAGRHVHAVAAILGGGAAGALLSYPGPHGDVARMLACIVNACGSSLVAYTLLLRRGPTSALLDRASGVGALVAAAVVASLLPAATGAALAPAGLSPMAAAFRNGMATFLSILVVTPLVILAARRTETPLRQRLARLGFLEIALPLATVAASAGIVFGQDRLPIAFLVPPALLLATFRLRLPGAIAGVAIVAAISIFATTSGAGPFAAHAHSAAERILLLQLFVATAFLCALPIAAVLAERDRVAADAHALAERFRTVVENLGDVLFQIDAAGRWTYLNPAWEGLTGRSVAETLGRQWTEALDEADRAPAADWIAPLLTGGADSLMQARRLETPTGSRWVELFVRRLRDAEGQAIGATGTLRDVHDARQREERATHATHMAEERAREASLLASTDELTGLPNRRAFLRQLEREIEASIEFGWPLCVAMFDVDHFKQVNDNWGHAVGDEVLRQVAERTNKVVRGADMVGRIGGEEFAILMPGAGSDHAARVLERLREAIAAPDQAGRDLPRVTVSAGVAERMERRTAERLLAVADEALYQAKQDGRNRVRIAA